LHIRDLVRIRKQVPVVIIEHNEKGRQFLFFKTYADKILFLGKLPVLSLLSIGRGAITMWCGGRFYEIIEDELINILYSAKLDEFPYCVLDFFVKKKQLVIYVSSRLK
jgi:hypothetical protein